MKGMEIQLLIECCINYFTGACYSSNRIGTYKSLWRNGIVKYMLQNRQAVYTPSVGAAFVDKCVSKKDLGPVGREKIRSIQVLDDFLNLGYIRKNTVVLVRHRLDGPIGKEMGKLVTLLRNLRRSEITIKDYEFYLSNFLKYLGTEGVQTPKRSTSTISSGSFLRMKTIRLTLSAVCVYYSVFGSTNESSRMTRNRYLRTTNGLGRSAFPRITRLMRWLA